jgi:TctA family transporter
LLGLVGTDVNSGAERFVYGVLPLVDGIGFVAVAIGMFGVDEIVRTLEAEPRRMVAAASFRGVMPTRHDLKRIIAPVLRGTGLGVVLGVLPSGGAVLPSFAAYALEKRLATDPERFGRGAIEGVAAPEAANNAGAQTSFIPMLALGLPSGPTMALMIGALIVHGVTPGPALVNERPELFWGVIASMWIGNLMLVILNLPLIGVWVRLLLVPYHLLYPAILTFCAIGAYSIGNSSFDVWVMAGAAVLGYGTSKLGCEPAPLLLGFILGPLMEENLRRALLFSRGDWSVFVERPISAGILAVTVLAGVATLWRRKPGPG